MTSDILNALDYHGLVELIDKEIGEKHISYNFKDKNNLSIRYMSCSFIGNVEFCITHFPQKVKISFDHSSLYDFVELKRLSDKLEVISNIVAKFVKDNPTIYCLKQLNDLTSSFGHKWEFIKTHDQNHFYRLCIGGEANHIHFEVQYNTTTCWAYYKIQKAMFTHPLISPNIILEASKIIEILDKNMNNVDYLDT